MSSNEYLYAYAVIEMVQLGDDKTETTIASYMSNAAPPQIGSTLDPGEFNIDGYQEYEVVDVTTLPHNTDSSNDASDNAYVKVFVKKPEKSPA
jgi:hypothetical protein